MGKVHLLSVVWYRVLPARFGGQKGIAEFNAFLSEHLPVSCICSADNDPSYASYEVENVLPEGKWQVINPVNWWKILAAINRTGATHLIVEHCYYALTGGIAKRMFGTPWILHEHNIEYLRFKELKRWWWPLLRILESWACRNATLVLFKTESDRCHAIEHFSMKPEQAIIVPFGIARDDRPTQEEKEKSAREIRQRHGINEDAHIIFFSGTLDYEPNARAFRRIVKHIIPALEDEIKEPFVVLVCGRLRDPAFDDLHRLHHSRLQFIGEVEEVDPYFLAADVFINPVDTGGGIKVKNMEALSYDLPVVSTSHSAIGIDRTLTGSKLRVSQEGDIPTFCRHIAEALTDKSHIPDAYFAHYQWRHLTNKVADAIKKLTI